MIYGLFFIGMIIGLVILAITLALVYSIFKKK